MLISAVIATVAAILTIDPAYGDETEMRRSLENLLLTGALGLPLFTAIAVFCEKQKLSQKTAIIVNLTGAFLLILYFITLPPDVFSPPRHHAIRFFLLNIGLHLLAAFAPFLKTGEENGFWQFNKTLFLRFLTAALYSGVLYIGLVIALQAVEHLFGVDVKDERYGQLWFLLAGVFNTWFFLSGIPEDLDSLEQKTGYPKGLKVFTQFILLPLVFIYLAILYAYEAKIILEQNWPRGWVANLVLGFSVTGILAILLVHPIRNQEKNKWIATFAKWYYVALIPLVIMLVLAIWRRISDYGITENRYFVLILALWLSVTVLYFLISKSKTIKFIPITLCLLAFLASGGPWGAFQISKWSQFSRLENYLAKTGILVNDKIQKTSQELDFEDQKEISAIVTYLYHNYGVNVLQPLFEEDLQLVANEKDDSTQVYVQHRTPAAIVQLMGISYIEKWQQQAATHFDFVSNRESTINIQGYDHFTRSIFLSYTDTVKTVSIAGETLTLSFNQITGIIDIENKRFPGNLIRLSITEMINELHNKYGQSQPSLQIPGKEMILEQANATMKIKLHFINIYVEKTPERFDIKNINIELFSRLSGE